MKKLNVGIVAHVDAGKTTLSEAILFLSGKISKPGRVDNQDAYLDTYELERARGITIFAKQALVEMGEVEMTLLDTPGHVDFSAEMERTLQVLDYAILVINGSDGVQGHTKTLWHLLTRYDIPAFVFVNKMDQPQADVGGLKAQLKSQLSEGCVDFGQDSYKAFYEELAMCDEGLMETYLETGHLGIPQIQKGIRERKVFPCFFGSALKLEGVEALLEGIAKYGVTPSYAHDFGAKIFKITRDPQGNRLTHMKITGGSLKVKDVLSNGLWEDKVNQIRIYSGEKYQAINEIQAGSICAVTGLKEAKAGEVLGIEKTAQKPFLEPVLFYRILLPEGYDARGVLPMLRQLEEEEPALHIGWDEEAAEIQVQMMGEVQMEMLQDLIQRRFGFEVAFDAGSILYKETIANVVEGVGHFEPLRHYAEVHLLLEPGTPGSGLHFSSQCSEDVLSGSWQRLILTHLGERPHKGVLTGSPITDVKITLVSGRAHQKHTDGGDFRQATYRAVRQGLMEAQSILLEPYYSFTLELPEKMVGRAMTDIERMHGSCALSETDGEMAVLTGSGPVFTMRNYQKEVTAYTKGFGRFFCSLKGYEPCHNTREIVEAIGYDWENDGANPTGSVFCANGAGFYVPWNEVKNYMHLEGYLQNRRHSGQEAITGIRVSERERSISLEEIDAIMNKTFFANQGKKSIWKKGRGAVESYYEAPTGQWKVHKGEKEGDYLLVDGYNIIHDWPSLKELVADNMEGARLKLLEILSHYQWMKDVEIIVVFDAYRVAGYRAEMENYENIHVVYTKEAQTADQYIEKFAHDNKKKYNITVATSDGLQQLIVRGTGASLLSARELELEIAEAGERLRQKFKEFQKEKNKTLVEALPPELVEALEKWTEED